ncbi:hypothetical protein PRK78_000158 [Emydomyces testavorans]|uniref:Uncharacterized protein n=1 Tax=Emydomyces testavorans TaxID=2070801 RepID=A0AAF0IFP6_9EURO|nr:hypothetical protein PRK78_000158 [Emydomyces testavorans]
MDAHELQSLDKQDVHTHTQRADSLAKNGKVSSGGYIGRVAEDQTGIKAVFTNGGPQALAWGIFVVVAGALAQSASLAEMAAMQPIAGAQYHWTHHLAPPRQKRFITWMQGNGFKMISRLLQSLQLR